MNLNDIFKYGVTPKGGEYAGKRFKVESIVPNGVITKEWDSGKFGPTLAHGNYKVWEPGKTVFEVFGEPVTLGQLKRDAAAVGLPDSTRIFYKGGFWGSVYEANVKLMKTMDGEDAILVY